MTKITLKVFVISVVENDVIYEDARLVSWWNTLSVMSDEEM